MATNNNNRIFSNFPLGFDQGVLIQNVQKQATAGSNIFWVGNNPVLEFNEKTASNGNKGTYHQPFSTIKFAISQCSANNNNIIYVRAGYAETIIAAAGIDFNVAGVTLIGLGQGANRPTLTFSTSTAATVTISAANVNISGVIGVSGIDQIVSPFVVSAAGCSLGIEWQDSASNVEAVRAVLTTAAADNFALRLKYLGQTGGSHCVNAVRLVGCDNGNIEVNFNGKASTSVVEFFTTACSNILVGGYMYNAASSGANKDIIDTVTGSTWFSLFEDGQAGSIYSGGSGAALSPTVPASQTTILNNIEQSITRNPANLPQSAAGNLFAVSGAPIEIIEIIGEVTAQIQNQANNTKLQITDTASSTTTDICSVVDIGNAAVGTFFNVTGTFANAMVKTPGGTSISEAGRIICPVGTIKLNCAASNSGVVKWYLRYRPMGTAATVVID